MTMHDQEFDREMREKFENYQPEPSAGLWDKIAVRLNARDDNQDDAVAVPRKPKRQYAMWWSAAAAILLLGAFAWWQYRPAEVMYLRGEPGIAASNEANEPSASMATKVAGARSRAEVGDRAVRTGSRLAEHLRTKVSRHTRSKPAQASASSGPIAEKAPANVSEVQQVAVKPTVVEQPLMATVAGAPYLVEPLSEKAYASAVDAVFVPEELDLKGAERRSDEKNFGVSSLLNMVVGSIDPREEKFIVFSNDDEGLIKMAVNLGRAKTRRTGE